MTTRLARPSDRARVRELIARMGGHEEIGETEAALSTLDSLRCHPRARALVTERGGRVVGYAELQARPSSLHGGMEGWLAALAVDPDHRGQGVGTDLLAAVEFEATLLGCDAIALESSVWRDRAHAFYESHAFARETDARRYRLSLEPPPDSAPLEERFLAAAARAASAVEAMAGCDRRGAPERQGKTADLAAERAAVAVLEALDLPIVGEEGGTYGDMQVASRPWIALDPIDGSRNFLVGLPPWAISVGLVQEGQALSGMVVDLASGRRWWAAQGVAYADGRRAAPRPGSVIGLSSPERGRPAAPPPPYDRIRVSGCTSVDLCRVAEGSLAAFSAMLSGSVFVQDVAAASAILECAGAAILDENGRRPYLEPDPAKRLRVAAAADRQAALQLVHGPESWAVPSTDANAPLVWP